MRRISIIGAAFLAVLAFGAISAVSASATLWLNELGESLKAETPSSTHGLLLLHAKGPFSNVTIHCEGSFDGWVGGPNGNEDEVTKVLNAAGEEATEAKPIHCEVSEAAGFGCAVKELALVYPKGLPWVTKLVLENGVTYDDFVSKGGGEIGYHAECDVAKVANECLVKLDRAKFKANTAAGAEFSFEGELLAKCSNGLAPEGKVLGHGLALGGFTVS